jgi:hypothetical protein
MRLSRPLDIPLLVEPGGRLDEDRHLLVPFGRALKAGDDRRSDARAIQRLLDRQNVGSSAAWARNAVTGS